MCLNEQLTTNGNNLDKVRLLQILYFYNFGSIYLATCRFSKQPKMANSQIVIRLFPSCLYYVVCCCMCKGFVVDDASAAVDVILQGVRPMLLKLLLVKMCSCCWCSCPSVVVLINIVVVVAAAVYLLAGVAVLRCESPAVVVVVVVAAAVYLLV